MDVMEWAAWPTVVVLLALVFRPALFDVLRRVRCVKWKGAEFLLEAAEARREYLPASRFHAAALLHDLGKYSDTFQLALRGGNSALPPASG